LYDIGDTYFGFEAYYFSLVYSYQILKEHTSSSALKMKAQCRYSDVGANW